MEPIGGRIEGSYASAVNISCKTSNISYILAAVKNLDQPSCQQEVLRRLQTVGPDSQRRWGKMSAHQMICHLSDSFRRALGEKEASKLPPNKLVKWVALWLPIPWPHGFPTRPELDQQIGGTKPVEFQTDMHELIRLMSRLTARSPAPVLAPHPRFGEMTRKEQMRCAYLHMNHHLRQFGA